MNGKELGLIASSVATLLGLAACVSKEKPQAVTMSGVGDSYCELADNSNADGRTSMNLPKTLAKTTREQCLDLVLSGLTNPPHAKANWAPLAVDMQTKLCGSATSRVWFEWGSKPITRQFDCQGWKTLFEAH